jgi:hypothetical protein
VHSRAGDIAGTVSSNGDGWTAHDPAGRKIGRWSSRREASYGLFGETDPFEQPLAPGHCGSAELGHVRIHHLAHEVAEG